MQSLVKNTAWAAVSLLAFPLYCCGTASAQEMETSEITVTATRTEKNLMEVPMSVGVVGAEDLKREPSTNVADALSGMPGVTVMDGGMPGGKRVMIRGESPMRSLILIDGVKVSEQKSMSGSAIMIDTSQIERIEVIKGPASVLYGSEAIGGVVNIITKKGGEKPVSFSQNFVVDSSIGSVDIQSAVFGSYKGFNYRFSGSGLNAGKRQTASGSLENSEYQNRYYSGQVGYDWDSGSFFVRADRFESEIHIPDNVSSGVTYSYRNPMAPAMGYGWYDNTTTVALYLPKWDRESLSAGLELNDLTANLTKLKINAYSQNMKKDFYNKVSSATDSMMGEVTTTVDIHTFNDQDSYGGSLQSEWVLGDNYLIAGLDYNMDELTASSETRVKPHQAMPFYVSDTLTLSDVEQSTIGLFVQNEWTPNADWALTLGLRQTWVESKLNRETTTQRSTLAGLGTTTVGGRKTTDSNLVGNVGLVYSGLDDWALRANWSQGYRFPSLNQMYLGTSHGSSSTTLPNPDLDPEESTNYEIGARYMGGNWNLDVAAFYTDAKNYITTKKISATENQFANMDKARTFGLELGLDYTFEEYGLTPYTSVTWLNRRIENTIQASKVRAVPAAPISTAVSYKTSDTGTSPFMGRVGLKWQAEATPSQTVFADVYMNWASSAKEYYYDNTYGHQYGDNFNLGFVTDKKAGWQTLNLTLGTEWGEEHKWNASLSLRNITDRAYTQADSMIEDPGFHVVVGVGFEY